jgi:hypothetical protein
MKGKLGTQLLLVRVLSIYPPSEDIGMDIPGISMAARAAAGITIAVFLLAHL